MQASPKPELVSQCLNRNFEADPFDVSRNQGTYLTPVAQIEYQPFLHNNIVAQGQRD